MKARLTGDNEGFATLEILIAFTVLILCLSAVIMVAFGNQSISVDSELNIDAISKAEALLEKARVDSNFDFNIVNPATATDASGPVAFTKKLDVKETDLFTKEVTATVSWQLDGRNLSTYLATILTDRNAADSDTCNSVITGDWKNPQVESSVNFSSITPPGTYTISHVDAYKGKLYITAGKTSNVADPTLFVFDISDTAHPQLAGKIDNDLLSAVGMNSIVLSGTSAYAANGSRPTLTGQLQIFDVTGPSPLLVKSFPLTGNTAQGNSIYYKNGYVYMGTKSGSGPEFNIIDVSSPAAPVRKGSYALGNDINAILARGNYAYIASPNAKELQVLDISNAGNPTLAGSFNAASGAGNGKSLYLSGNTLYLGKTTGSGSDFHILDASNPASVLPEQGGRDIASSVNGVLVRDYLSFLLTGTPATGTKLQIFRTDSPTNITPWNTALAIAPVSNATEPSMDCEGNRLYISSNDASGQGTIYIIKPGDQ